MRVLVVDDSGTMRLIHRRVLASLGITDIVEASDGFAALSQFRDSHFDMVLTDWNMPQMNGLELILAIRVHNRSVPIILVTTEAERSSIAAAIQAGVSDYLIKPFHRSDLATRLSRWMNRVIRPPHFGRESIATFDRALSRP